MTTPNMHEMANYFSAAGAALERAPALERERDDALRARDEAQIHSQRLEERIGHLVESNDELHARLREVEAERDTFRDEAGKLSAIRDRLVSAFTTASDMVQDEIRQVVPQPEPEPTPEPITETKPMESFSGNPVPGTVLEPFPHTADPTPPSEPNAAPTVNPAHRYSGKLYQDVQGYIPYQDWIDGGGTEYGYNYRGLSHLADS